MNKLVSAAIGVPVRITGTRINLPDILELKGKRIKHIDFADSVAQTIDGEIGIQAVTSAFGFNAYLRLMEQNTRQFLINGLPIRELALSVNSGARPFINKIIDFPNSYIEVPEFEQHTEYKDKIIFLVFWYDEPLIMQRIQEGGKAIIQHFEVDVIDVSFRKIFFGDNRTLIGKKFRNIFYYYLLGYGKTPSGKGLIDITVARSAFMTLRKENLSFFKNVPVYLFFQQNDYYPIRLQNITFDFLNSYIEVAPGVQLNPNTSFFFNCEIDDND